MADQETIAQRIVKLLAKAEGASTPEEAETFFDAAARLQAKHAIDEMMLAKARGQADPDKLGTKDFVLEGIYAKAHRMTIHYLAKAMGMESIELSGYLGPKKKLVRVHGFDSDLTQFEILYTSLLIQETRALRAWIDDQDVYPFMTAAEKFQARKSFIIGFGEGASKQVREARQAAVADKEKESGEPGVGLVLADRKTQVSREFDNTYGRTTKGRGTKINGSAHGSGRAAGSRADVGSRKVGGGSRRELG